MIWHDFYVHVIKTGQQCTSMTMEIETLVNEEIFLNTINNCSIMCQNLIFSEILCCKIVFKFCVLKVLSRLVRSWIKDIFIN